VTQEACLTFDPIGDGPVGATIVVVPPLFDEANRTRRTLVVAMRALATLGHRSCLSDLPGQNDSLVPTATVSIDDWCAALATIVTSEAALAPVVIASIRGGSLIDHSSASAAGWWRLAPVSGSSILKTMLRTRIASEKEAGRIVTSESLLALAAGDGLELAGHTLSPAMIVGLQAATPAEVTPSRSVTIGNGIDQLPGSALWLRAEPGEDIAMAMAMAADISRWSRSCVAG
jgi:hypothetical protein